MKANSQKNIFILILYCSLFSSSIVLSQSYNIGALDTAFNKTDVGYGFGLSTNGQVYSIANQLDGKVIIGGRFTKYGGKTVNYIARIGSNGVLDSSFNKGGIGFNYEVRGVSIQADGKIVVIGAFLTYNGISSSRVVRLNTDGTFDNTFNTGIGANSSIVTCAIQPDGKIIVGGYFTSFNNITSNYVCRLNGDGTNDTLFNYGGVGLNSGVSTITLQPDGKIILGGEFSIFNGINSLYGIIRLNVNGTKDPTFYATATDGFNGQVYSITIQADNKIVVGGNFSSYNNITIPKNLIRLFANGQIDTLFNKNGIGFNSQINVVSIQADGRILAGGYFTSYNNDTVSTYIIRLKLDGKRDSSFNRRVSDFGSSNPALTILQTSTGKILLGCDVFYQLNSDGSLDKNFYSGTGATNSISAMGVQTDGKILIGGKFIFFNGTSVNGIARLNVDGSRDTTFNKIGVGANNPINAIALQVDGKIIIGGEFSFFNGVSKKYIARLNADGTLDATFNINNAYAGTNVHHITIQPDNKILISNSSGLSRVFANGSMDNSLITSGSTTGSYKCSTFGSTYYYTSSSFRYNPTVSITNSDGSVLLVGRKNSYSASRSCSFSSYYDYNYYGLYQLSSTGTELKNWLVGESYTSNWSSNYTSYFISHLLKQTNGQIILAGNFVSLDGIAVKKNITRLNADYKVDTNFNKQGVGLVGQIKAIALQPNGKIIVTGNITSYNNIPISNGILRLNTDGSLDVSFYGSGSNTNEIGAISPLSDNRKVLVAGSFESYNDIGKNNIVRLFTCVDTYNIIDTSICSNQTPYFWNGSAFYTSVNKTANFINAQGCDSIATLILTVNPNPAINLSASQDTLCSGSSVTLSATGANTYVWQPGNLTDSSIVVSPTSNTTYSVIGTSTAGCASMDGWKMIAAGGQHSVGIKSNGTLWAWGFNGNGQLGDGTLINRSLPVQIGTATDWQSVAVGFNHTISIKSNGTLWAWGFNSYGQLGDGSNTNRAVPTQIGVAANWLSISAGENHSLATKTNGTLWSCGANVYGQLGDGTTTNRNIPTQVGVATDWQNISAGIYHSLAKKSNGSLWAWGWNFFGQLGDGTTSQKNAPVQVGTATDWQSIASGGYQNVATKNNGALWAWGWNASGQLGDGTTTNRSTPIQIGTAMDWNNVATSYNFSMGVKNAGTLWAWGNNSYGQLGDGTTTQRNSPIQIGATTGWQKVAVGEKFSISSKTNGTLFTWGNNSYGQLGDGTMTQRNSPVQISVLTNTKAIIVKASPTIVSTTPNARCGTGTLGLSANSSGGTINWHSANTGGSILGSGTNYTTPSLSTTTTYWVAVTLNGCSSARSAVVATIKTVTSSTSNAAICQDQLPYSWNGLIFTAAGTQTKALTNSQGCDSLVTLNLTVNPNPIINLSASQDSICNGSSVTLTTTGASTYVWQPGSLSGSSIVVTPSGNTSYSVVGTSANGCVSIDGWKMIAAGESYIVGLKANGTLWAWGSNDFGQLGDGTNLKRTKPVQIGIAADWQSVAVGYAHSMALKSNGTLWAWGKNSEGQLGDGTTTQRNVPTQISSGTDWQQISLGQNHTIAIKSNKTLWGWGWNGFGQLGDGTNFQRVFPTQIGLATDWQKISSGEGHSIAIKTNGTIWGWGWNGYGQLGDGTTINRNSPTQIGSAVDWQNLDTRRNHNIATKMNGTLWAWGWNQFGQIGDGTTINRTSPIQIGSNVDWNH